MPQQLKQFVENSKKQKEFKNYDGYPENQNYGEKSGNETEQYEGEIEFGKHFLFSTVSSEDENVAAQKNDESEENKTEDGNSALNMSLHE